MPRPTALMRPSIRRRGERLVLSTAWLEQLSAILAYRTAVVADPAQGVVTRASRRLWLRRQRIEVPFEEIAFVRHREEVISRRRSIEAFTVSLALTDARPDLELFSFWGQRGPAGEPGPGHETAGRDDLEVAAPGGGRELVESVESQRELSCRYAKALADRIGVPVNAASDLPGRSAGLFVCGGCGRPARPERARCAYCGRAVRDADAAA